MVELRFVSSNPGKAAEVRAVLAPYGVKVRWLRRRLPEIQSDRLEDVARYKLAAAGRQRGYILVEDSGLFVDALGGFPGVYSAHVLDLWGFGPLLRLVRGRSRSASFRTVAALGRGGRVWTFSGRVDGRLAVRARGRNGFGYDPIFEPHGWTQTLAEATSDEKNAISHRARALRKVGAFLRR